MDTVTHALLGAAVAALAPSGGSQPALPVRQRLLVGATAAAFPDVDFAAQLVDPLTFLSVWHRGVTHSLVMLPVWALAIGWLAARLAHARARWPTFGWLAAAALASHIAADVVTMYGVQVFAPLSSYRLGLGTTFVVDPLFSLICIALFTAGALGGRLAGVGLLLTLCAYVMAQSMLKDAARRVAADYGTVHGAAVQRVDALPQPFSPTHWKLVLTTRDAYHMAYLNLLGWPRWHTLAWPERYALPWRHYRPPDELAWQRREIAPGRTHAAAAAAWWHAALAPFRDFAVYPVVDDVQTHGAERCVWFTDARYVLPFGTPAFRYGMCEHADGGWRPYRLRWSTGSRERL